MQGAGFLTAVALAKVVSPAGGYPRTRARAEISRRRGAVCGMHRFHNLRTLRPLKFTRVRPDCVVVIDLVASDRIMQPCDARLQRLGAAGNAHPERPGT